ncbi:MAG TPA: DUF4038 domain-containing protein [Cellulomonas sp.]
MTHARLTVEGGAFLRDGRPFLYLADTVWSAFTNPTDDEWCGYLDLRREQGFTAVQIDVLPQWDRTILPGSPTPFTRDEAGRVRWDATWDDGLDAYLAHARRRCVEVVRRGLVPVLVVLWSNYVPGTWASAMRGTDVMPLDRVADYVRQVAGALADLDPVWVVGGDTDLGSPETVAHYRLAADVLREQDPDGLRALHLRRGDDQVPDELAERIQVLLYQSGHNRDGQGEAYRIGAVLSAAHPGLAVLNGEPCYEGMGYSRRLYGRFGRREVRAAVWGSLLSGADAGVSYGAHGVWNWHVRGHAPDPALGEGFDESLPWVDAVQAPGAWDVGTVRQLLETVLPRPLAPCQGLLVAPDDPRVRVARAADGTVVAYLPVATRLVLRDVPAGAGVTVLDLARGRVGRLVAEAGGDGGTTVPLHRFDEDVLVLLAP